MVESAIWLQIISKDDFICENVNYNAKGCELHYEQSSLGEGVQWVVG